MPKEQFAPVCVIIDKLDKIGDECVKHELMNIGLDAKTADTIIASTGAESLDKFAEISGTADSDEVKELRELFVLAKDYGIDDWLQFDASVVRGLAYYTGVVFEGFDRSGVMRAIFGGGRYDRLMLKKKFGKYFGYLHEPWERMRWQKAFCRVSLSRFWMSEIIFCRALPDLGIF